MRFLLANTGCYVKVNEIFLRSIFDVDSIQKIIKRVVKVCQTSQSHQFYLLLAHVPKE